MHKYLTILMLALSSIFLFSCQNAQKQKSLKLAHGHDPSHPVHKAMQYMARTLEEKSKGKLTISIYPSGQLGNEQQRVELLQIGSLAMTKVSAAAMESFSENFQVLGLPYVFRSKEHSFKVLDGEIGQELLLSTQKLNIRGLCFYDAGARSFYTLNDDISKPTDLDGLKIRVMKSKTAMNMVKALGGSPTPISYGELYTALQSGVVDGAENNPPSFYSSRHYEVCKYYCLDEHTRVPDVLILSTVVWNNLTDQEKTWLQESAKESVIEQRKYWAESEKKSLEKVISSGVKVSSPEKEPFMNKVQELLESYKSKPELFKLIKRIQETE